MSEHTEEPWFCGNATTRRPTTPVYKEPYGLGDIAEVKKRGDARRIVACVNACAGLDIDLIEKSDGFIQAAALEMKRLIQQRDELLAELGNIANARPTEWNEDVADQFREWAQNRARAVITKVERGQ